MTAPAPGEPAKPLDPMAEIVASGVRVELSFDAWKEKFVFDFHEPDREPDRAAFRVIGYHADGGGWESSVRLAARCFLARRDSSPRPPASLLLR